MPRLRRVFRWFVFACAVNAAAGPAAGETLTLLARPGPWAGVSALISCGDRLWFANSVPFENHNAADLYSYDPRSGEVRYEANLLSQGPGRPVVANGLLYWPFEDSRASTGRGEFMVTDGRRWTWHLIADGQAFHIHAMAAAGGSLYAATSAWRGAIRRSDDRGRTWRTLYEHPSPSRSVSRFTELAILGDTVYAGLTAWREDGPKLYRVDGDGAAPAAGWPAGRAVTGMAAHRGWLYAVNHGDGGSAFWRTDGVTVQRLDGIAGERVRALASGDRLWAVTLRRGGGALHVSDDGIAWRLAHTFDGEQPTEVALHGSGVYVGTIGLDGRPGLWGPPPPAAAPTANVGPPPPPVPTPAPPAAVAAAVAGLDRVFEDPASYARHAETLRATLRTVATARDAATGDRLAALLRRSGPRLDLPLFGGAVIRSATVVGRWYVLWALAFNGRGRVPPALLAAPWTATANGAQKYLEPAPLAMWAAARLGQADAATLGALVDSLGDDGPAWLDGDRVGALTALTGQRFAYDVAAWRAWWAARR